MDLQKRECLDQGPERQDTTETRVPFVAPAIEELGALRDLTLVGGSL